jgi:hypothetical protein
MKYFEPVFIVDNFKLLVVIKVPNSCHLMKSNYVGVPDDVPTPTDNNLHHTIAIENARIAESILPGEVSFSAVCSLIPDFIHIVELDYRADDDNGIDLWVHVAMVDPDDDKPKEKEKRKVERKIRWPL